MDVNSLIESGINDLLEGKHLNGAYLDFMINRSFALARTKPVCAEVERKMLLVPADGSRSFKLKNNLNALLQGAGYEHGVHNFILIPVDNSKPENEKEPFNSNAKAHHWILLLLVMDDRKIYTFDSLPNEENNFYGIRREALDAIFGASTANVQFIKGKCPKEINENDSAVHVSANALKILEYIVSGKPLDKLDYSVDIITTRRNNLQLYLQQKIAARAELKRSLAGPSAGPSAELSTEPKKKRTRWKIWK